MSDDESNNYEYTKKIFNEYQINYHLIWII